MNTQQNRPLLYNEATLFLKLQTVEWAILPYYWHIEKKSILLSNVPEQLNCELLSICYFLTLYKCLKHPNFRGVVWGGSNSTKLNHHKVVKFKSLQILPKLSVSKLSWKPALPLQNGTHSKLVSQRVYPLHVKRIKTYIYI